MRARRTTTARGLGGKHQSDRAAALNALLDGDLCFRCQLRGAEHPMFRAQVYYVRGKPRSDVLDLDDYPGRRFGGPQIKRLSYRSCNRSEGATAGNVRRGALRAAERYNRW